MEGVVRATLCSFQSALASTWDFVVNRKLEPRLTGCQHQLACSRARSPLKKGSSPLSLGHVYFRTEASHNAFYEEPYSRRPH